MMNQKSVFVSILAIDDDDNDDDTLNGQDSMWANKNRVDFWKRIAIKRTAQALNRTACTARKTGLR